MAEPQAWSPSTDDAEALLERHLSGDPDAFEGLVALFEDKLYGFLERFLGDSHMAEDVFQQVFIKVAAKGAGFNHRSSFSTWLFSIARNTALDELRRRRRQPAGVSLDADDYFEPVGDAPRPVEIAIGRETHERILAAVAMLPPPQREAFLLKEEADLGFQEMADILGCPRETAKSRFRLAVEKLRSILAAEGFDPGKGES